MIETTAQNNVLSDTENNRSGIATNKQKNSREKETSYGHRFNSSASKNN